MKSSTDPIHFQGIEEEEKKALAKLPSVHMIVPLEEGGDGEKNEESGESDSKFSFWKTKTRI